MLVVDILIGLWMLGTVGCTFLIFSLQSSRTSLQRTIDAQKRVVAEQSVTVRKLKVENDRLHDTNGMINDAAIKQIAVYKAAVSRGDGAIDRVAILLKTVDDLNTKIRQLTTKKPAKKHRVTKVKLVQVGKKFIGKTS